MAREEQDRENLLAEATALVERASLLLAGSDAEVFVGFRPNGAVSFYFSADRVYHLNSVGHVRRAHLGGKLFKAERGRLVSLARERSAQAVELVRHELTAAETSAFLAEMRRELQQLRQSLAGGDFRLAGQVPKGADVVGRIQVWLAEHADRIAIADGPRAC